MMQRLVLLVLLCMMFVPGQVQGMQQATPPRQIAAADSSFSLGLAAFEQGDYPQSERFFRAVLEQYSFNMRTTAARIMAAKAAYRRDRFRESLDLVDDFADEYPTSRYVSEADHMKTLAEQALSVRNRRPIGVGIILSLDEEQVSVSQALFNGIRFAVDDHNNAQPDQTIRMVFRDTGPAASGIRQAVRELSSSGVSVIVGTLFSEDAIVAAEEAERQGVVFIAPLATDDRVSAGRRLAFQANPSIAVRGEQMARFAIQGLQLTRLGVIAVEDPQNISERLSDAFVKEASRLGAEINLIKLLHQESEWYALPDSMAADTLSHVDALFVPMVTRAPIPLAGAIMDSMERFGRPDYSIRLLGNSAWHDLPMISQASRFTTTYFNDFYLPDSDPRIPAFETRYRTLSGVDPERPAFVGYDLMTFLAQVLETSGGDRMDDSLRNAPEFSGLGMRISFEGSNLNRGLFYHRYRDGRLTMFQ